jgi:hypothetical protein
VSDGLELLLTERALWRALTGFASAMDRRDWSALEAIIAADATADLGTGEVRGRAQIVDVMRSFLDACGPTQHLLGNFTAEISGATASTRVYVSDRHVGAGDKSALTLSTLGEYHDQWQRRDERWWLVRRVKHNHAVLGSFEVLGPGPQGWRS